MKTNNKHSNSIILLIAALIIIITVIVIILLKPNSITSVEKTLFEDNKSFYSDKETDISVYNGKVAFIKETFLGQKLEVFINEKRVFSTKGDISGCQLMDKGVYYINDENLMCSDYKGNIETVAENIRTFQCSGNTIYYLRYNGELLSESMNSEEIVEISSNVSDFCVKGNDLLVTKYTGHSVEYTLHSVNLNDMTTNEIISHSGSIPFYIDISDNYYIISDSGKLTLINKGSGSQTEIDFSEGEYRYEAKTVCCGNHIYVSVYMYDYGPIFEKCVEGPNTGIWDIDESTLEKKQILSSGVYDSISIFGDSLVGTLCNEYYLIDMKAFEVTHIFGD